MSNPNGFKIYYQHGPSAHVLLTVCTANFHAVISLNQVLARFRECDFLAFRSCGNFDVILVYLETLREDFSTRFRVNNLSNKIEVNQTGESQKIDQSISHALDPWFDPFKD